METKLTIDRFEGDKAVLKLGNDTIIIPVKLLPDDAQEGTDVFLQIVKDQKNNSREVAKNILNEILGTE